MLARNILIFHAAALGDFILSWPIGLALGRLHPQSRIIYVTQRQKGLLAEKAIRLESLDAESGWHHLFGDADHLPESCRTKLRAAHLIVTFIAQPGDAWTSAVTAISPQSQIVAIDARPPRDGAGHVSQHLLQFLAKYPAMQSAVRQILASIAAQGIAMPRQHENGPVAIHPGSGSPDKCWPVDSYLRLIDKIRENGQACKILLGEVELERWPAATIRRLESAAETAHPATYIDLLRELSTSRAFIGNDSGPGHLAGIIGLPAIILYGPTDPVVWRPLGPRVMPVRRPSLGEISPEEIYQALCVSGQTSHYARAD